jgi:hypothetical protein
MGITNAAKLHIKGDGETSGTKSLRVENSSGIAGLQVNDDGTTYIKSLYNSTERAFTFDQWKSNSHIEIQPRGGGRFYVKPGNILESFRILQTGQVGISDYNKTTVIASAVLEIESTTRGFLPPRMTGAQVEAITTPAEGLMVYATNAGVGDITAKGWWGYNGTNWEKLNN